MNDAEKLAHATALDAAYASAADFDALALDRWVKEKFSLFTKRTEYPKLGYLIHLLNEAGIASILHGESAHGPCLYVDSTKHHEAWKILTLPLDETEDDAPAFQQYASTRPDTDLYT